MSVIDKPRAQKKPFTIVMVYLISLLHFTLSRAYSIRKVTKIKKNREIASLVRIPFHCIWMAKENVFNLMCIVVCFDAKNICHNISLFN